MPSAEQIIQTNKFICEQDGNPHHCYGIGKLESAVHSAFYPGAYPFAAGGIAKVAGVLCFYIVQTHAFMDGNKRTGALAAITFLNQNGLDLKYPINKKSGEDELAKIIEECASGKVDKNKLADWFETHKVKI